MKIYKLDTILTRAYWLNWLIIPTYLLCMIILPGINGKGDMEYLQNVWDRWQALNVGILAFIASLVAFHAAQHSDRNQQKRNFRAAQAFLPAEFSSLTHYLNQCAKVCTRIWKLELTINPVEVEIPSLPENYKSVFGECIQFSEAEVGDYLAKILVHLQVHDARLRSLKDQLSNGNYPDKVHVIINIFNLGELQAFINKAFDFARNEGPLDLSPLCDKDLFTAYSNMKIHMENFVIDGSSSLFQTTQNILSNRAKRREKS